MSSRPYITGKIKTDLRIVHRGDAYILNFEVEVHDGSNVDYHKCTLWGQPGKVLERL